METKLKFQIHRRIASLAFFKTLFITASLSLATPTAVAQTLSDTLSASEFSRLVEPEALQNLLSERDMIRVVVEFDRPVDSATTARNLQTREGMQQLESAIGDIQERILMRSLDADQRDSIETERQLGVVRFRTSPLMALNADAELIQRLSRDPDVIRIHIDHELQENMNDTLPLIGMPAAYAAGATGTGQAVVVIDSGTWRDHEFLDGKVVSEACFNESAVSFGRVSFCPGGAATSTAHGSACTFRAGQICNHGTHVAGTAAGFNASASQFVPASGVARSANIVGINVSSCSDGNATSCSGTIGGIISDAVAALEYVLTTLRFEHDIAAVNISQGIRDSAASSPCQSSPPTTVIADLRAVGIATVVSAGNSGLDDAVGRPYACIAETIAVANTTKGDQRNSDSNWGSLVDLAAPGTLIRSSVASASDAYALYSGTSMAAPHVAGAFAAIRSARPDASVDAILAALQDTGTGVTDVNRTHPRINVDAALLALDGVTPTATTLSGPASSIEGESFTLTAEVTSLSGTPSGNVQFRIDGEAGALRPLNSAGIAEWQVDTTGTPPGTYTFTAQYLGENDFAGSSASLSHVIFPDLPPPPNDLFADRITIPGPGTYTGSTVGATSEPGQPYISATNSTNAIWWRYTPPADGTVNIDLCESDYDTSLAVFTGSEVSNLSHVVSDDVGCGFKAEVEFEGTAGTEYQIGVGGWGNQSGNVVMNVDFTPDTALVPTTVTLTGPTTGIFGEWMNYNALVEASSGMPTGTVDFLRNGEQFSSGFIDASGNVSMNFVNAIPVGTHEITAYYPGDDTFAPSISAAITVTVTLPPPANNLFADRITLSGPGTVTGTNQGATSEPGQPSIATSSSDNAVWWRYTAPEAGTLAIDTCGSNFDTTLAVFTGSSVSGLSTVASNDDFCGLQSGVEFEADANTEYQIAVAGWSNDTGDITLNLAFEALDNVTETVLSAPSTGTVGEDLTFEATVSAETGTPTGSVSFRRDGTEFASSMLNAQGSATVTDSTIPEGAHEITAHYLGNADFEPSSSESQTVTITAAQIRTVLILDVPNGAYSGQSLVFRATVSSNDAVPTGVVHFWRDDEVIGTASVDNDGTATLGTEVDITLPEGNYEIGAEFTSVDQFADSVAVPQRLWVAASEGDVAQLAVGGRHVCARTFEGSVYCWGANDRGQLGDRSTDSRHRPRIVQRLYHPAVAISAGLNHSCALLDNGRSFCWGDNSYGQLGNPEAGDMSDRPVRVQNARGSRDISTPGNSSCRLNRNDGMQCWGENSSGQLGNDSTVDRSSPVRVRRLARDNSTLGIGGTGAHNCALNRVGRVFCWGENADGQVGDGSTSNHSIAMRVDLPRNRNWRAVAIGEQHSCAANFAGRVFCWGENSSGAVGDGTLQNRLSPVPVQRLGRNVQELAVGSGFSCALNRAGLARCWGSNADGRLGAGLAPDEVATEPARVRRLRGDVRQIAVGATSACAISAEGDVYCWGANDAGQIGRPAGDHSNVPLRVRHFP